MKKCFLSILIIIITLSVFGCESKEERKLREARETSYQLEQAYEKSVDDYNELKRDIAEYKRVADRLKNAK